MAVWGGRSVGEGGLMMPMPMMKSAKAVSVQTVYEPSRAGKNPLHSRLWIWRPLLNSLSKSGWKSRRFKK